MIPAAFGVIRAALGALDNTLDPATLDQMGSDDLGASWRAAIDLCKAADDLHGKLRAAYANEFVRADTSREKP